MRQPYLSIIIPNYNGCQKLKECLFSVLDSEYQNFHIIVYDNNSTIIKVSCTDDRVTVLYGKKNIGFAGAVMKGVEYADRIGSHLIFVLNNDCTVKPDTLGELLQMFLTMNGQIQCFLPLIKKSSGSVWYAGGRFLFNFGVGWHWKKPKDQNHIYATNYVTGCAFMATTKAMLHFRLPQEYFMYNEDMELSYYLHRAGIKAHVDPRAVVYHHVGASSNLRKRYWLIWKASLLYIRRNVPFVLKPVAAILSGGYTLLKCLRAAL